MFVVWIVLLTCVLIIAGPLSLGISSATPAMKKRDVPSNIFSEERVRDYLNNLTKFGSRVGYSHGNLQARNYLITEIKRIFSMDQRFLRLELELQNVTDLNDTHSLKNILVRVSDSRTKSKNISSLLLSAHYDSGHWSGLKENSFNSCFFF